MSRSSRGHAPAALLLIVLAGCRDSVPAPAPARAPSRGIVLVTVDGWWDPQAKTDSIPPAFIPNAVRLTNAMTPSPQVRPAICSILTGKSPLETGVRNDVTTPLPESIPIVSRTLAERGWRTAAFVADPRVGIGSGLERGFEVFDPPKEILFGSFRQLPRVRNAGDVVADFATWIGSVPESSSFFAWIQISRPIAATGTGDNAAEIRTALEKLSKLLDASARLENASVAIVGTAGQTDPGDGERSGYILNPDVLRVPALLRPGPDPGVPFSLTELAAWISVEAGVQAGSHASTRPAEPLLAWTYRGRDEFGWPAEVAAHLGSALCVQSVPGSEAECVAWTQASAVADGDRQACLAALGKQPKTWADPLPIPAFPGELIQRLDALGIRFRPGAVSKGHTVSRETRVRLVPAIMRARRFERPKEAPEADAAFQAVVAADPGNFGALIEAGEILALNGRTRLARERLERALQFAPSHPEAWHWLGHVSYLETQLDRADAQWQVSDSIRSGNGDVLYDLACSRSLLERVGESDAYLRRAWTAGFREMNKIQVDPDLRNLRADPAFLRFMREVVH